MRVNAADSVPDISMGVATADLGRRGTLFCSVVLIARVASA